jgi:hypothetical protein
VALTVALVDANVNGRTGLEEMRVHEEFRSCADLIKDHLFCVFGVGTGQTG